MNKSHSSLPNAIANHDDADAETKVAPAEVLPGENEVQAAAGAGNDDATLVPEGATTGE